MATFAYAPAIRVHIESEKNGILDVSGDIVNWNLSRRSNTVSSFNFTLQNTQRKYDGQFWPGDRITVEMKRIVWVRVFTGTLNTVPVFSSWPRALPLSASCSLKKLQFWPWDPTTQAANDLVAKWFKNNTPDTTVQGDAGLKALMVDSLVQVTNWNPKAIHVGEVPNTWFKWAEDIEKQIDLKSTMQQILGSFATIGGQSVGGEITLKNGSIKIGNVVLTSDRLNNAVTIFSVVVQFANLTSAADQDRAAAIAIATAWTESTLVNLDSGPGSSVGLFQQETTQGWGTFDEIKNEVFATKSFLGINPQIRDTGLLKLPNWRTMDPMQAALAVQRPGGLQNYYQHFPDGYTAAQEIVSQCRSQLQNKLNGVNQGANRIGLPPLTLGGQSTGYGMAGVAINLITSRPPGAIKYQEGGDSAPQDASPTVLDCSSLVEWVYYHTTGELLNHRTSEMQYGYINGAHQLISLDAALSIQGALLFRVDGTDAAHVGVSLGNGYVVAANNNGLPLAQQVDYHKVYSGEFTIGGLLPNIDYSQSGTTPAAVNAIKGVTGKPASQALGAISLNDTNPGGTAVTGTGSSQDPFQALINLATAPPVVNGNIFGGARKLINNQPFLPWLKNICNSSMRSFCSAPNGDFMAWFPDYFDITDTAAKMQIEPIELIDFTVEWSDQQIVTHEFVTGTLYSGLDQTTGSIVDGASGYAGIYAMLSTYGIATMDFPEIFKTIYGHSANPQFLHDYLSRFGARPNLDSMPNIFHGQMEFCMALWNFMYYWSSQFNANVQMTFMPELWPGMIIRIPYYNFQAYVTDVTHQGSYGAGGQFTTTAHIIAPAMIDPQQRSSLFGMFADILPAAASKI